MADYQVVARPADQTISCHGLDHRPVLPEEFRGVVNAWCLHLDAARLSSAVVRNLKMERVGYRLRVFAGRPAFAAHLVSPHSCVEPGHSKFTIWLFVGRVDGEVGPASALGWGFVPGRGCECIRSTNDAFGAMPATFRVGDHPWTKSAVDMTPCS